MAQIEKRRRWEGRNQKLGKMEQQTSSTQPRWSARQWLQYVVPYRYIPPYVVTWQQSPQAVHIRMLEAPDKDAAIELVANDIVAEEFPRFGWGRELKELRQLDRQGRLDPETERKVQRTWDVLGSVRGGLTQGPLGDLIESREGWVLPLVGHPQEEWQRLPARESSVHPRRDNASPSPAWSRSGGGPGFRPAAPRAETVSPSPAASAGSQLRSSSGGAAGFMPAPPPVTFPARGPQLWGGRWQYDSNTDSFPPQAVPAASAPAPPTNLRPSATPRTPDPTAPPPARPLEGLSPTPNAAVAGFPGPSAATGASSRNSISGGKPIVPSSGQAAFGAAPQKPGLTAWQRAERATRPSFSFAPPPP